MLKGWWYTCGIFTVQRAVNNTSALVHSAGVYLHIIALCACDLVHACIHSHVLASHKDKASISSSLENKCDTPCTTWCFSKLNWFLTSENPFSRNGVNAGPSRKQCHDSCFTAEWPLYFYKVI